MSRVNQIVLVLGSRTDAEVFVDNVTTLMAIHSNIEHIWLELMEIPNIHTDPWLSSIYNTCCVVRQYYPNQPLNSIYIDSIDDIENNTVTITVGLAA